MTWFESARSRTSVCSFVNDTPPHPPPPPIIHKPCGLTMLEGSSPTLQYASTKNQFQRPSQGQRIIKPVRSRPSVRRPLITNLTRIDRCYHGDVHERHFALHKSQFTFRIAHPLHHVPNLCSQFKVPALSTTCLTTRV